MRCAGDRPDGLRTRGLIVVLWRAGLRISEALSLAESDLDPARGAVLVRRGKAASVARSAWTRGRQRQRDELNQAPVDAQFAVAGHDVRASFIAVLGHRPVASASVA